MAINTQGSQIFILENKELYKVGCPMEFTPGGIQYNTFDATCLEEDEMEQDIETLAQKAETTLVIMFDPQNESHMKLYNRDQSRAEDEIKIIVCTGDDKKAPNYDKTQQPSYDSATDKLTLPANRHSYVATGTRVKVPFAMEPKSVIKKTVTITQTSKYKFNKAA